MNGFTAQETRHIQKLMAATSPRFQLQLDTDDIPESEYEGVDLKGAIKTTLFISCREELHRKTARVFLDAANGGDTLAFQVDGKSNVTSNVGPGDTPYFALADLKGVIDGSDNTDLIETSLIDAGEDSRFPNAHILIKGKDKASFDLILNGSGSSGEELHAVEDAEGCQIKVYMRDGGVSRGDLQKPERWVAANSGEFTIADQKGFTERFVTAGYSRLYVEVMNATSTSGPGQNYVPKVDAFVGPSL